MMYLGDYAEDAIIDFNWSSNNAAGASVTRATNGTISVYKANSTTQSTAGVTDSEDFDSLTGIHHVRIDTSADAFYAVANDYSVVLSGATIDGQTVNAVLAHFSIENRSLPPAAEITAGQIRDAIGMASANLDAQLAEMALAESIATLQEVSDAILEDYDDSVVDGTITRRQYERIVFAILAGLTVDADTTTPKFLAQDGTTPRVSALMSGKDRASVTLDGD